MTDRMPLIAGNWKMYKTGTQGRKAAKDLVDRVSGTSHADIMIAPAFPALYPVFEAVSGSCVKLGAQNLYWEEEGAYTGEVSASMLTDAGCEYVIIGHSERRQYFGETDETVNKKIRAAVDAELIPVLCVGETEAQRDNGETFLVLDKQIKNGLNGFFMENLRRLVIAYEPVWAIGTGKTASREQAQEAHAYIRQAVAQVFDDELARSMRILYGGSVKPNNIAALMEMPDVDGALVGGASLDPESFSQIVQYK